MCSLIQADLEHEDFTVVKSKYEKKNPLLFELSLSKGFGKINIASDLIWKSLAFLDCTLNDPYLLLRTVGQSTPTPTPWISP